MPEAASGIVVRRAGTGDAAELTRLREVMFGDMDHDVGAVDQHWRGLNVEHFRTRLLDVDSFAAFVVDKPEGGIAACAVGWLNPHLVGLRDVSARTGYIANMSTDTAYRRRGYGRATLAALLDWMRATGIGRVNLHASHDGEALYRSVGFADPVQPGLTLRL